MSERADKLSNAPEKRYGQGEATAFQFRDDAEMPKLDGYASVFEARYDVFGGPKAGGWVEVVDRRAFDRTLAANPDVHLLVNHDGMPLANTIAGDLRLGVDKRGLHADADLDMSDVDVQHVVPKIRRRNMREMSFAFRTPKGGDEWSKDQTERRLLEVNIDHGDVSIVNFGSNPATTVQLRAFTDAIALIRDTDPDQAFAELRDADDPLAVIAEAERALLALRRQLAPSQRRLSVAAAEALIASPR